MSTDTFLGIDLGTSNSVAMVFDGQRAAPVRTSDGSALLPSVVRIDARGTVSVGARARKFLETDPENTRSEFKRLMGSERKLAFAAAKVSKSPEELSALVLEALRTFVSQAIGHAPTVAVITVPALFELPQIRATSEAARLAGFERVEHLQEPVASALTAGFDLSDDPAPWLVYDLGGGTFDVSLLETREGVLRVVGHDGDNFLGGRDMDARLLEHTLGALGAQLGRTLSRRDPGLAGLVRRLRSACEDAKFELGTGRPATISLAEPVLVLGEEVLAALHDEVADALAVAILRSTGVPIFALPAFGPVSARVFQKVEVEVLNDVERVFSRRIEATKNRAGAEPMHEWLEAARVRGAYRRLQFLLGDAASTRAWPRFMFVYCNFGVQLSESWPRRRPLAHAVFKCLLEEATRFEDAERTTLLRRNVDVTSGG